MERYCPICFRKIKTNANGKVCRHGFKKNRWVFEENANLEDQKYKKVDSSPCRGTGKIGLTLIQMNKSKKKCYQEKYKGV